MSPFLHFPDVETEMLVVKASRIRKAEESVPLGTKNMPADYLGTVDDLVNMLSVDKTEEYIARLKFILATSQGSLETLDRICMVLCPSLETWSQRRLSQSATLEIAGFLMNPNSDDGIPWYTAERFRLPTDWLTRMRTNIAAEIHNSLQSLYNTKIGQALEDCIGTIVVNEGYSWEKGFVSFVDEKEVDVAVPGITLPRILIMSSYNITTASSQGQRAREQKAMYQDIGRYNSARVRIMEPDVQLANIIDGAGWLKRKNDLRQIHQHCDYALSFNQLDQLPDILHYHMQYA